MAIGIRLGYNNWYNVCCDHLNKPKEETLSVDSDISTNTSDSDNTTDAKVKIFLKKHNYRYDSTRKCYLLGDGDQTIRVLDKGFKVYPEVDTGGTFYGRKVYKCAIHIPYPSKYFNDKIIHIHGKDPIENCISYAKHYDYFYNNKDPDDDYLKNDSYNYWTYFKQHLSHNIFYIGYGRVLSCNIVACSNSTITQCYSYTDDDYSRTLSIGVLSLSKLFNDTDNTSPDFDYDFFAIPFIKYYDIMLEINKTQRKVNEYTKYYNIRPEEYTYKVDNYIFFTYIKD